MGLILLIIVLLLLFGGGGSYYGYRKWGRGGGIGVVGVILIVLLVLYLFGGMHSENVQPGALAALRIGELFEQPPPQRIQDALFIRSRISSRVQVRLTSSTTERLYI
jgi:uncharacterized protein DUF3309